jgi:TonB family protein
MRNYILVVLLWGWASMAGLCQADSAIYLSASYKPVPKERAVYFRVDRVLDAKTGKGYRHEYYISGTKYQEINYAKLDSVREGPTLLWHKNGQLEQRENYVHNKLQGKSEGWFDDGHLKFVRHYEKGKLHGEVKSFHQSGQLRRQDMYAAGELVEGHCFDEQGAEVPHYPHMLMPEFPGGLEAMMGYIGRSVKIPFGMRLAGAEGRALIGFIIDKNGKVSNVEVLQTSHEALGKAGINAIKSMPRWAPGQQEGEKVSVRYTVPIKIKFV